MRFIDYAILGGSVALLAWFILMFGPHSILPLVALAGFVVAERRRRRR